MGLEYDFAWLQEQTDSRINNADNNVWEITHTELYGCELRIFQIKAGSKFSFDHYLIVRIWASLFNLSETAPLICISK